VRQLERKWPLCEKAAQKLLLVWAGSAATSTVQKLIKFFASFCSQKEALSYLWGWQSWRKIVCLS
jgi:hypothetical protein